MKHTTSRSLKTISRHALLSLAVALTIIGSSFLAIPARAANFIVTNTSDVGPGSLRDAIANASINPGPDTISFNIPSTDPRHFYYRDDASPGTVSRSMIAVTAAADDGTIADIDPDWPHSWYSIETAGFAFAPLFSNNVMIDGLSQPGSVPNTNPSGALNSVLKIELTNTATDGLCSRIFHARFDPVVIRGMILSGCRNLESRLIDFDGGGHNGIAIGNYIGTDASGTIGFGSGYGVQVSLAHGVRIGGNLAADRNLISGNWRGININSGPASGASTTDASIIGNLIGTARDGVSPLGNGTFPPLTFPQPAIEIFSNAGVVIDNRVENNVIAFNAGYGILLTHGAAGSVFGNRITNNAIHSNGNIGINLEGRDQGSFFAVTPNDPCDADVGMNGLQNFPVIKRAVISGNTVSIAGTLNSTPGGIYDLEFFASPVADVTFFGEGQTPLGSSTVTIPADSCNAAFEVSLPLPAGAGVSITATATDAGDNTSEFSAVYLAHSESAFCVLPPDGLVSWYSAQGNVNDTHGENHGRFFLSPSLYGAGKIAQAFDLPGRNNADVIEVPDDPSLDFTSSFSIEMWVAPSAAGHPAGTTFLISKGDLNNVDTQSYGIILTSDLKVVNRVGNGTAIDQVASTSAIPLNQFTHIATTYDGTTLRVYVNGVLDASQATSIGTLLDTGGPLFIGGGFFVSSLRNAVAAIDEPSLYNRALSDAEIASIHGAGTAGKCRNAPVECAAISLSSAGPVNASQHIPFSRTVSAFGGTGLYTYSLTGGQLPAGLSLDPSTGEISGTPTEFTPGLLYFFTVAATDTNGCTGTIDLSMSIEPFSCALVGNAPTAINGNLIVDGSTATTINMACLVSVSGNLVLINNEQAGVLDMASLATVSGNLEIADNPVAGVLNMASLVTVSGNLKIANNPAAGVLNMASLVIVSGNLDITNSLSSSDLDLGALTSVGGTVNMAENTTSGELDLSSLTSTGGTFTIAQHPSVTVINIGSLVTASGSVDISGNSAATIVNMNELTTVSGDVTIVDNQSAHEVTLGSLNTVSGSVDISGNNAASIVNINELTTVTGDVTIVDNQSAYVVALGSLETAGVVNVGGNTAAATVDLGSLGTASEVTIINNGTAGVTVDLNTVSGDVNIESTGSGTFSIGDGSPAGEVDLVLIGYTSLSGATAGGQTSITNETAEARMSVELPGGAYVTPVNFSITHQGPATLMPAGGTLPDGTSGMIDPVAAYQFNFGVPTLNQDASLVFEILVSGLDQTTRDALLAAVASGNATLVTKGDAPDSTYQTFAICVGSEVPTADGCVKLETLDAGGQPTAGTPSILRFSNVVGHFSTWAVAIVTPDADMDGVPNSADNCPNTPNPDQADADADGIGDVCDPDDDNDGVNDDADLCPGTPAGTQVNAGGCPDTDGDGVADANDNCPLVANPDQADADNDGIGDACDTTGGYTFTGFFQPVDNLPVVNVANAGSSIPLKFGLGGYHGLNIFAAGFPTSGQVQCNSSEPAGEVEETVNSGGSSLSYDPITGRYTYVWKTNKAWKGTCRLLVIRFADGTQQYAKFRFK
jgi:hypothetical protein